MSGLSAKSMSALGFLTVVNDAQHGLFGGYLLLNTAGRPLEFHCTAPIKPNRAQEILYGPTLEAFLYGEQIGQTLIAKAKTQPKTVFTDRKPAMAVREHISLPVALVMPSQREASKAKEDGKNYRIDAAHDSRPRLITFELGQNRLAVPESATDDRQLISQQLAGLSDTFDLVEPFQRIREAIEEAQQAVR